MKPICSLFQLAAATSFWRILRILLGLCVIQVGVALWMFSSTSPEYLPLEHILDHPLFRFTPSVTLTLTIMVLIHSHGGTHSRVNYTMHRLSVSQRTLFLCYILYGIGVLLLFWFVQVAIVAGVSLLYQAWVPQQYWSQQLLLLTSYRSVYLHPLLPMCDWPFWIATPLIYTGLGISAAVGMFGNWDGKFPIWPLILGVCTAMNGAHPGNYSWVSILSAVILLGAGSALSLYLFPSQQEVDS